ncbi:MAG: M20/M25/M40 family metallo-hydrolase [Anaerolineae bacterium]|nr:M20/M25/M40 family metallo-hydrolase [Anaerolineae bacterium]
MHQELMSRIDDAYTLHLLEEMIAINSVVGQEGRLAEYLYAQLEALGLPCEMQPVEPDRFNVYARLAGVGPGRRLNFNAHFDTVPVCEGWDTDPFTPVLKEGRLYGLGACDMKAGIACILAMLKAFVESGHTFRGELSFSGVVDEEAYSKGARAMLDTDLADCDAIVLAEPYAGDEGKPIPLGITGKVLYNLTVRGHAAHGFSPHLGINAVEEAARLVAALDRLPMREHPDFGRGNTCTLKIEGGYQVYSVVVPDLCRVEINRLLVPGETSATAVEDMQALVRSLDLEARVDVALKPPRYEPFLVSRDEPIIQIFYDVYREMMGTEPLYVYSAGITDANVFGERGIPCLHLGPARGNIHQPNEYVALQWLERLPRMYASLAARFLVEDD